MGYICRTRIGILVGMGKIKEARSFYKRFYCFNTLCGIVLGVICFLFRHQLVNIYSSSNPEESKYFMRLVIIYSILLVGESSRMTPVITMKTINKIRPLLILCCVVQLGLSTTGAITIYLTSPRVEYYAASMTSSILCMNVCTFIYSMIIDWKQQKSLALQVDPTQGIPLMK